MSSDYQPVTVEDCREIAERRAKDQVVIVAVDRGEGRVHLSTWGRSPEDKVAAAHLSDQLMEHAFKNPPGKEVFEDFRLDAAKLKTQVELLTDLLRLAYSTACDTRAVLETQPHLPRSTTLLCDLRELEQRARDILFDDTKPKE